MLSISRTARFKRDYKSRRRSVSGLDAMLADAVDRLARREALPDRFKDHPLIGSEGVPRLPLEARPRSDLLGVGNGADPGPGSDTHSDLFG